MTQPTVPQVLSALRAVKWNGEDIVSRNMVVGVTFAPDNNGAKVNIIIQIDPQKKANIDELKGQVENAIKAIDGVSTVAIIFTAHQAPQQKHSNTPQKMALPNIKYIIAVASGKGGVGKSTTAVNIAAAFTQKGLKVGLLDADIYGPSIPRLLGVTGEPSTDENQKIIPHQRYGMDIMSIGFLVADDAPMIWRGPMVHKAIIQLFRDVAWGRLDILVVDLPPGTGDAQLTIVQSVHISGAVIVSTPQDIALLDARKGLSMFQRTEVPVLGIIENMSFFECPHCGGRSDIFSHGGAQVEANKLGIQFLGEIPLDIAVRQKSDEGMPLTFFEPDGTIASKYRAIADRIWLVLNA